MPERIVIIPAVSKTKGIHMRYARLAAVSLIPILLAGCATAPSRKANELQIKQLQSRVDQLESETGSKDEDIARLERKLMEFEKKSISVSSQNLQPVHESNDFSSKMTVRQIQSALRKAGFYNEAIDGKMGPRTKAAIKEFQKEYGLKPDGVVGTRTRSKLMYYK